jgi:hypothetical protein
MPQYPARPWQSRQEMLVDIALQSAISDPETIRATRPVVPQELFPETRGLVRREMSVTDVLTIDRNFPTYRSWVSGAPVMFKDGFMDENFSGSSRYSMQGLWS